MNKKKHEELLLNALTSFILWMTLSYISWLQFALLFDHRSFLSCSLHCVWKSHRKVAFNIASELHVYIHFKWTKLNEKCKNFLDDFQILCVSKSLDTFLNFKYENIFLSKIFATCAICKLYNHPVFTISVPFWFLRRPARFFSGKLQKNNNKTILTRRG